MLALITENTYLMSDHHFVHKRIGDFEPARILLAEQLGYDNYEEMIIDLHNKTVKVDDVCLFLGDFSFGSPEPWVSRLKGIKILVIGNHDTRGDVAYQGFDYVIRGTHIDWNGTMLKASYEDQKNSMIIKTIQGKTLAFTHYPLGFDDGYNRQEGGKILERMKVQEELADSMGVEIVVHGHLHSKIAKGPLFDYINVSGEQISFIPTKLGKLLEDYYENM